MWWGQDYFYYQSYPWHRLVLFPFIIPLVVWALFWKGLALYRAVRNEQKGWFVALLIVNTAGILDIIYLLFFSQPKSTRKRK